MNTTSPFRHKNGPPLVMSRRQKESFRKRITIEGEHWLFDAHSRGRDDFSVGGKTYSASRVMWCIYRGIPEGQVRRTCGVAHCVRPSHHLEGLNKKKVGEIKETYATGRYTIKQLAERCQMNRSTVSDALLGRNPRLKRQLRATAQAEAATEPKSFRNAYPDECESLG